MGHPLDDEGLTTMHLPDLNITERSELALEAVRRAIGALTVEQIERHQRGQRTLRDAEIALLDRSIGADLMTVHKSLAVGGNKTLLSVTAAAIDEALLMLAEAEGLLAGKAAEGEAA